MGRAGGGGVAIISRVRYRSLIRHAARGNARLESKLDDAREAVSGHLRLLPLQFILLALSLRPSQARPWIRREEKIEAACDPDPLSGRPFKSPGERIKKKKTRAAMLSG